MPRPSTPDRPLRPPIRLEPHNETWKHLAAAEAQRLREILGRGLVVHHIGSTAIPTIRAKPTIDLLPVVGDLASADAAENAVRALGYDWRGEFGLAGRRFCALDHPTTGERLVNLHIYAVGDKEIDRHLAFRDFLLSRSDLARDYETEKLRALRRHPRDVGAYTFAKSDWIVRVEALALEWRRTARTGPTPPLP